MKTTNTVKCVHCGKIIDLDEGAGCTDENGDWLHEHCADAIEFDKANESDLRD